MAKDKNISDQEQLNLELDDPLAGAFGDELPGAGAEAAQGAAPAAKAAGSASSSKKKRGARKSAPKTLAEKGEEALNAAETPKKRKKNRPAQIWRNEDLKKAIEDEAGDDIDTDVILSSYLPRRRIKMAAQAILRMDRLRLFLFLGILLVIFLFLMAFLQEKAGNFTINLDRLELYRKGIAISADGDFTNPTARLTASPVINATNIAGSDIPGNVPDIDGDHNGENYMAYTYYLRNAGKEDVALVATVNLVSASKDADNAVRVAIWHNGERTVYARPSADGETPEPGCENFYSDTIVCRFPEDDFKVGYVNKYTVAVWLEGDDPECVDAIVGGAVEFTMKITASNEIETTLLQKYIQDIKDTLTGNKPINPAGTVAPDFQRYENVTWETRRNREDGEATGVNIN